MRHHNTCDLSTVSLNERDGVSRAKVVGRQNNDYYTQKSRTLSDRPVSCPGALPFIIIVATSVLGCAVCPLFRIKV